MCWASLWFCNQLFVVVVVVVVVVIVFAVVVVVAAACLFFNYKGSPTNIHRQFQTTFL